MKREYLVNVSLIAVIAGLILIAATGCGGGSVAETPPAESPSSIEPMDYNDPKYTDAEVIDHMMRSTYADFDPANALARVPVIEDKLAKAEKALADNDKSIRFSGEMIKRLKKELSYFPPSYLNWEEYRRAKGDDPVKFKETKNRHLANEVAYSKSLSQRDLNIKFQVKLRKEEIKYLKGIAS